MTDKKRKTVHNSKAKKAEIIHFSVGPLSVFIKIGDNIKCFLGKSLVLSKDSLSEPSWFILQRS